MFHNHNGRASELKQAGAIEAARDPNSKITSEDAERTIVAQTKAAGGTAFQFDPNASPAEKAAQAKAHIAGDFHHEHKPHATGIVSDADDGETAGYDLPSPTTGGALPTNEDGKVIANGHVAEDQRYARDRTGWAPRFGQGDPADDMGPTLADHQSWLEGKLEDKWFGDWYHNTAIIIFACLSTHITTLLGGGLGWVFLILAFCATYYRTSIRRVRRNLRDDVLREMAKTRLETDTESLEWINSFLVKFWPIFAPQLCTSIIASVDQVLSTSTPAFLDSLRMKTFILGTKPPRMEHVKTYPKSDDDTVLMDWKFSFNPNDIADLTSRQLKNKINPKVALEVRIGKGVISKGLDVIVEDFAFSGVMRVKLKLQIPFPHVEKAEICFLGRPTIDYVCKPLGGDMFGFDINFIPGLEGFILEQIHANLEPIMYAPHVFPIEIAKIMAGNPVDQAVGVVQVTLHGAQSLKNSDAFAGVPDPYATVSINNRDVLGKTKTIPQNENPRWNETVNVIVTSLKDSLSIAVFDYNEFRKDKQLGIATFTLDRLETETVHENMQIELVENGRARGAILADIRFFPVIEGEKLPDGTKGAVPESNTGIAKFTVEQAKELDGSKSLIGQLNPYAVLLLNGKEIKVSQKLKRTNNPIWSDAAKEFLITDRQTAKLAVVIKDDRGMSTDPILGTYQLKLNDMMELMAKGQEWYMLAGAQTGRAKMMLQWKPVALKGSTGGGGYLVPIGVLRLHLQGARELRNFETIGKSDPYTRVLLSGIQKGRTITHVSDLSPTFDEIIYVPVHNGREKVTLEVMDEEKMGKDRSLGMLQVAVSDYLRQDESGAYLPHDEKRLRSEGLKMSGKGAQRGFLDFTCSFYPTYDVADPEDEGDDATVPSISTQPGGADPALANGTPVPKHKLTASETASKDMLKKLAENEADQTEAEAVKSPTPAKMKLTKETIKNYQEGLVIFRMIDAELAHSDCYVEVVMDDSAFPAFKSSRIRQKRMTLNETGEAIVRELDVSRLTIRICKRSGDREEVVVLAKQTGDTITILGHHLYETWPVVVRGEDDRESRITVQMKYLPLQMALDPSESINNQGSLRCDVLDAIELPAADRNGFSDPYCKFILNDKQIFKTQTQKKTLQPAWNEYFVADIPSRTAARFSMEVWDWDRGDSDDLLGRAEVNLGMLEAFQAQELTLGLDGKSGTIRLKLLFKPAYVTRSKMGTSTFSGSFAVPGKVVGAPVKGVGKGAVFLGGNVIRAASFAGRSFRKRKTENGTFVDEPVPAESVSAARSGANDSPVADSPYPPSAAGGAVMLAATAGTTRPTTPVTRNRDVSSGNHSTLSPPQGELGMATITILSATGYTGDNICVIVKQAVGRGIKQVHKTEKSKSSGEGGLHWHEQTESFRISCTPAAQFVLQVREQRTFGKDVELGEGALGLTLGEQQIRCGAGTVLVRTAFVQGSQMDGASLAPSTVTSPGGRSRRRFLSGLGGHAHQRESIIARGEP